MSEEIKPVKPCRKCGAMDRYKKGECRPCAKARHAKYRAENPEKEKAYSAKYQAVNPEKGKARCAKYQVKLKESAAAKTFFQMLAGAAAIAEYIKEQNNKKTE